MSLATQAQPLILPATSDDLPAIAELARIIWRAVYVRIISNEQIEYMLQRGYDVDVLRREMDEEGVAFERLFVDGRLIGFAAYGPTQMACEIKLHKLYLHPDEHRKGYGSMLLEHVEKIARARGFATLILAVNKNNHKAIAAYRRNGFTVRAAVVVDIGGGFVMDDYVMAKTLVA